MKRQSPSATRTLVQVVRVEWSNASRGGPLATPRNRVPAVLPFEASNFDVSQSVWIEQQDWGEPDFACPRRVVRLSQGGEFSLFYRSNLATSHGEDATRVAGALQVGERSRHISVRYDLLAGQITRLKWNGRSGRPWRYYLVTLNVARVEGDVERDIFTARPPNFSFESLARLR